MKKEVEEVVVVVVGNRRPDGTLPKLGGRGKERRACVAESPPLLSRPGFVPLTQFNPPCRGLYNIETQHQLR